MASAAAPRAVPQIVLTSTPTRWPKRAARLKRGLLSLGAIGGRRGAGSRAWDLSTCQCVEWIYAWTGGNGRGMHDRKDLKKSGTDLGRRSRRATWMSWRRVDALSCHVDASLTWRHVDELVQPEVPRGRAGAAGCATWTSWCSRKCHVDELVQPEVPRGRAVYVVPYTSWCSRKWSRIKGRTSVASMRVSRNGIIFSLRRDHAEITPRSRRDRAGIARRSHRDHAEITRRSRRDRAEIMPRCAEIAPRSRRDRRDRTEIKSRCDPDEMALMSSG